MQKNVLLFRKNRFLIKVTPVADAFDQIDYFEGVNFQCLDMAFPQFFKSNRNFDLPQLSHQNLPRETKE